MKETYETNDSRFQINSNRKIYLNDEIEVNE